MQKIIFMNIGWMSEYKGLIRTGDKIKNGGKYTSQNGTGGEVCNFLSSNDGYCYGFVERNRKAIQLSVWNDSDFSENVTVFWTATAKESGQYVVGFYKNATVYSEEQSLGKVKSKQHSVDNIHAYSVKAKSEDVYLIPEKDRYKFKMPKLWVKYWRVFSKDVNEYEDVKKLIKLLSFNQNKTSKQSDTSKSNSNSTKANSTAKEEYVRYVQEYEVKISPRHNNLQNAFKTHIENMDMKDIQEDWNYVDLKYTDKSGKLIFAEIKPCDQQSTRFAIRQAIGQLLDYKHRQNTTNVKSLIVLEIKPSFNDIDFAKSNGFGIAYPLDIHKCKFAIEWA